jgi:hypothetical protein
MKKTIRLTESDLIKMVNTIINEEEDFGGSSQMEVWSKKVFPNIKVIGGSVMLNGKFVFNSDSQQCVEAFLFGLIVGKSQNSDT